MTPPEIPTPRTGLREFLERGCDARPEDRHHALQELDQLERELAALRGAEPDFNTESNLHADTVAERFDAAHAASAARRRFGMSDKWVTVPRLMTDEMFNAFSEAIGPLPEQYARITKAWYFAVHAAPMPPKTAVSEEALKLARDVIAEWENCDFAPPLEGDADDALRLARELLRLAGEKA